MSTNIESNSEIGSIEFKLPHNNYYTSGETVSGSLILNLKKSFQGHILELKITREENTKFLQNNPNCKRIKLIERGKEEILGFTKIVQDFAQGSGNESFNMPILTDFKVPFQLTLGPDFPSSLEYDDPDSIQMGSLKYTLYAYLIPTNPSIKPIIVSKNINIVFAQSQAIIAEQQPAPQLKEFPFESCHLICWFCFCKEFKLSYAPNKLTYYPGEEMLVTIKGNLTQFSYNISNFKVLLLQIVKLSSNPKKYKFIQNIISEEKIESSGKEINAIARIPIPSSIKPSTFGEIIKLYYSIRIQPYIQESCMDVKLTHNNYPNEIKIVVPPNKSKDISDNI